MQSLFVKVMPRDYKRVLHAREADAGSGRARSDVHASWSGAAANG